MTLILGVICFDGIVMAGDSQITAGNSKNTEATKLHPIRFGKIPVLVAEAGRRSVTAHYIRILKEMARNSDPKNEADIAEIVQAAMVKVYGTLSELYACAPDALSAVLKREEIDCVLLFGFQIGWRSSLLTIDIYDPIPRFADSYFEAHGTGALLGDYLLREHSYPDMPRNFVISMAVHIAEVVKKYDLYCSGETAIGVIQAPVNELGTGVGLSRIHFIPQRNIQEFAKLMATVERETQRLRADTIQRIFEAKEAKIWKELDSIPMDSEDEETGENSRTPKDGVMGENSEDQLPSGAS